MSSSSPASPNALQKLIDLERALSTSLSAACKEREEREQERALLFTQVRKKSEALNEMKAELKSMEENLKKLDVKLEAARSKVAGDQSKLDELRGSLESISKKMRELMKDVASPFSPANAETPSSAVEKEKIVRVEAPVSSSSKRHKQEEEEEEEESEEEEEEKDKELRMIANFPMTKEEEDLYSEPALLDAEWDKHPHGPNETNTLGQMVRYREIKTIYERMMALRALTAYRIGDSGSSSDFGSQLSDKIPKKAVNAGVHVSYSVRQARDDVETKKRCAICGCPFKVGWSYVQTCSSHVVHLACVLSMDNVFRAKHAPLRYFLDCPAKWTFGARNCSDKKD
jgi:hypothetical protein